MPRPVRLSLLLGLLTFAVLTSACPAQGQTAGPANAVTWSPPPSSSSDRLLNMPGMPQPPNVTSSDVDDAVNALSNRPEGRRWLLGVQVGNYIAQDGWVDNRENPHDRTEATTLSEIISSEDRTSISVNSMPYGLPDGHELLIQTGDPSNVPLEQTSGNRPNGNSNYEGAVFAYVDGSVSSGATTIPIDDGSDNPVTITASSGDRVLSDFQSLWPTHASGEIKNAIQQYVQGFVDAGVDLDGIALDTELEISPTKGIKHDPRWEDSAKGFVDGESMKGYFSSYTIDEAINRTGDAHEVWKREVGSRVRAEALTKSVLNTIQKKFPNAKGSDWNLNGVGASEAANAPNTDGKLTYRPYIFGTHGNFALYASIRNLDKQDLRNIGSGNQLPYSYGNSSWATLRWQVKLIRTMVRENDGAVQSWLPFRQCCGGGFYVVNTKGKYFREHWIQMMLHTDPDVPALYFNPSGADGHTDQQDQDVDGFLKDVNEAVAGDSWTNVTSTDVSWTSDLIATAVDLPDRRLWRISVRRVDPFDDRAITVNVSNGDTVTIPGGEVGAWYETGPDESPTFSYTHPPVDNLLPSDSYIDFTSSAWNKHPDAGDGAEVNSGYSDPDGGTSAYRVQGLWISNEVPVEPGERYTFSWWAKIDGDAVVSIRDQNDLTNKIGGQVYMGVGSKFQNPQNKWYRGRHVFEVPEGKNSIIIQIDASKRTRDRTFYRPMLNRGKLEGPYERPEESIRKSFSLFLHEGGNLVSSVIQPSDPDLNSVLGDAITALAQVETEDGQVFDPDTGTDEIGTWDSSEAYKIYAETPTSFSIEGTSLDSTKVSLDEGWNWLPYLDSTSVAIDQALEPIQNDLVMVKDEAGRVYQPAQNTNQIQSLEPGTAYKILLENPVTLSYPLE